MGIQKKVNTEYKRNGGIGGRDKIIQYKKRKGGPEENHPATGTMLCGVGKRGNLQG